MLNYRQAENQTRQKNIILLEGFTMRKQEQQKNILTIKDFEQPKSDLIRDVETLAAQKQHILYYVKHNLHDRVNFKTAEEYYKYNSAWLKDEDLQQHYNIVIDYNGVVPCYHATNNQPNTKTIKSLFWWGATLEKKEDPQIGYTVVMIFKDCKKNKFYYFSECDFMTWADQQIQKQKAIEWCEFIKSANILKNACIDILNKYEGKQAGERTREKIQEETMQKAQEMGLRAWFSFYNNCLDINHKTNNNITTSYYITLTNSYNAIQYTAPENVHNHEEGDGAKIWKTCKMSKPTIQKKAAELIKLIKEYNDNARIIHQREKATESIYRIDLDDIARGDF